jgi:hypothetical protein
MAKDALQVALDLWGPVKVAADERTLELWGRLSRESLERARGTLLRPRAHSAEPGESSGDSDKPMQQ